MSASQEVIMSLDLSGMSIFDDSDSDANANMHEHLALNVQLIPDDEENYNFEAGSLQSVEQDFQPAPARQLISPDLFGESSPTSSEEFLDSMQYPCSPDLFAESFNEDEDSEEPQAVQATNDEDEDGEEEQAAVAINDDDEDCEEDQAAEATNYEYEEDEEPQAAEVINDEDEDGEEEKAAEATNDEDVDGEEAQSTEASNDEDQDDEEEQGAEASNDENEEDEAAQATEAINYEYEDGEEEQAAEAINDADEDGEEQHSTEATNDEDEDGEEQQAADEDIEIAALLENPLEPIICLNEGFHLSGSNWLLFMIEQVVTGLLEDFVNTGNAKFTVVRSDNWENIAVKNGTLSLRHPSEMVYRNIAFRNLGSRHHFALMMYVLAEAYSLLSLKTTCTVRQLFYKNPELFKKQNYIYRAIKDVCSLLNATPWELGFLSSSKGLVAGSLRISMENDDFIDCSNYVGPTLLPHDVLSVRLIETRAQFVLIVEKDTVFEQLLNQNILMNMGAEMILITGKGFPDIGTRLMIKRLWTEFRLPIYALVDADPFGIEILFVYRYGSKSMAHNADKLACPHIRWIGIHPSEIDMLSIPTISQTARDQKKISELLQRSYLTAEIRHELELLRETKRKAEIEAVSTFSLNFLISDYIPNKIRRNLII